MKTDLAITNPHVADNGKHPGDPGDPGARPVPWWLADASSPEPVPVVETADNEPPNPMANFPQGAEPLPIIAVEGKSCPKCNGPLVEVRTFDGWLNLECLPCDQCFGCRRDDASVEQFSNGGGRHRDLFGQEGEA